MHAVPQALQELKDLISSKGYNVHFPVEVRFVRGDDIWCSPAYGRDTAYIGVIMYKPYGFATPWREYFDGFERIMASLGGRPHWAKDFRFTASDMAAAYPKWADFRSLTYLMDPRGLFSNNWANTVVRGVQGTSGEPVQPWLSEDELVTLADAVRQANGTAGSAPFGPGTDGSAAASSSVPPPLASPITAQSGVRVRKVGGE